MNTILEQINSMGQSFVEFAWPMLVQSSVLIVILLLVDFLLCKRVRAVFRYWLWMLVLLKLILPSSLSLPVSVGYWFGDELANVKVSDLAVSVNPADMPQAAEPAPIEVGIEAPVVTPREAVEPAAAETSARPAAVSAAVSWQGVVFLVWLAVVAVMALLLLQRAFFVIGLVAQAGDADSSMNDAFEYCRGRMGIKGKVGLKVSANATSPAVCGLFRPVVLLPENLGPKLQATGLRAVLMHELAHIKRGDLWVNLAQTVLQIVYFYNPLLWLANAVIRRVREQAVDEMVQVAMGEKARQYPQTLVDVAKLAFKRPALSLRLIGVVESKSALKGRIKRMLNRPIPKSAKLGIVGLMTVVIIGAVLLPMAKATAARPEFIISGTVTDAETGQAIAGVKVGDVDEYANGRQWTITDSDGKYSYATWYEEHGIKAEAPGYEIQHKGLYTKLFGSEKEKVLDFELAPEKTPEFAAISTNGLKVKDSRELLMERRDILQKTLQTVEQKYNAGRADSKELQQAKIDLLRVESQLAQTHQKRIKILEQIVALYKDQEKTTQLLLDAGKTTQDELDKVKLLRLEAEKAKTVAGIVEVALMGPDPGHYVAFLPNGVTIELVGVCEHPSEGKQWWQPDGSSLSQAPYESRKGQPIENRDEKSNRLVEFAVSFAGEQLPYTDVCYKVPGATRTSGGGDLQPTPDGVIRSIACEISKFRDTAEVRLGIAAGQWKTMTEYDGRRGGFVGPNDIVFSGPIETKRGTTIAVRGEWGWEGARRITAIDKKGKMHTGGWNGRSTGLKTLATTEFYDVKPEQIQKYQLQFRPYQWVEFKNVSLRPGVKTDVQIEVERGKQYEGVELKNKWERWEEQMHRWGEKFGEKYGKEMEDWGEEFGEQWEQWGEQMEEWGRQMQEWQEERRPSVPMMPQMPVMPKTPIMPPMPQPPIIDMNMAIDLNAFKADPQVIKEQVIETTKRNITKKLQILQKQRLRVERDLAVAEDALDEVRDGFGIIDLEERSYPHPITARLTRLQTEKDNCVLEISQQRAKIDNLQSQGYSEELKKAEADLIVLQRKCEELHKMVDEAKAEKKNLDHARSQYQKRVGVRDERKKMLNSIKSQIEKLRIMYEETESSILGKENPADVAVYKQLDEIVDLQDLTPELSFSEAIEILRNSVDPALKIIVLWRDLYDSADIEKATTINMDAVSGIRLGTALKLLLKSVSGRFAELGYVVDGGVIVIATKESLPHKLETRVYDTSDVLSRPADYYAQPRER